MMQARTKQSKICNLFHLSLKIKGLTAVNSGHCSCQLPWLGSRLSKMKRRETPPATRVLSTRMNESRKFGWVDTNVLHDYNRPANSHNSAWTSQFFTLSHRLMTRLPVSRVFGKLKFRGEWYCLFKPWWHLAVSFVPSDLFPGLL